MGKVFYAKQNVSKEEAVSMLLDRVVFSLKYKDPESDKVSLYGFATGEYVDGRCVYDATGKFNFILTSPSGVKTANTYDVNRRYEEYLNADIFDEKDDTEYYHSFRPSFASEKEVRDRACDLFSKVYEDNKEMFSEAETSYIWKKCYISPVHADHSCINNIVPREAEDAKFVGDIDVVDDWWASIPTLKVIYHDGHTNRACVAALDEKMDVYEIDKHLWTDQVCNENKQELGTAKMKFYGLLVIMVALAMSVFGIIIDIFLVKKFLQYKKEFEEISQKPQTQADLSEDMKAEYRRLKDKLMNDPAVIEFLKK